MDADWFDAFTRSLTRGVSRRYVLKGITGLVAGGVASRVRNRPLSAQESPPIQPVAGSEYAVDETRVSTAIEIDYFALGDSIASGHGLMDTGGPCHRSPRAYPYLVANVLGDQHATLVRFPAEHHLACSGAKTGAIEDGDDPAHWFEHQVDEAIQLLRARSGGRRALISVTIGANDFDFLNSPLLAAVIALPSPLFETWVEGTAAAVASRLQVQIERLLNEPGVAVVLTDYYNPTNQSSIVFNWLPTETCLALPLSNFGCYERTNTIVDALNSAITDKVVATLHQQFPLLQVTDVRERFRQDGGHEAPLPLCGTWLPTPFTTWVQYPGDPESNSLSSMGAEWIPDEMKPLQDLARQGRLTGDCIHPTGSGAMAIAEEVIAAALPLLKQEPSEQSQNDLQITSGPFITMPSQTAAVVTWSTNLAATGAADYRIGSENQWHQVTTETGIATEHRATLSGLEPGQTYSLRVQNENENGEAVSQPVQFTTSVTDAIAVDRSSPEAIVQQAVTALTRDDLAALGALYPPGSAPQSWSAAWSLAPLLPDFTSCGGATYDISFWTPAPDYCTPTDLSTEIEAQIYLNSGDHCDVYALLLRLSRRQDGWYLAELTAFNTIMEPGIGNEPCVDNGQSPETTTGSVTFRMYACPPGVVLENHGADGCTLTTGGALRELSFWNDDLGPRMSLSDAEFQGNSYRWNNLPLGVYNMAPEFNSPYVAIYVPGLESYTCGAQTEPCMIFPAGPETVVPSVTKTGYHVPVDELDPHVELDVFVLSSAQVEEPSPIEEPNSVDQPTLTGLLRVRAVACPDIFEPGIDVALAFTWVEPGPSCEYPPFDVTITDQVGASTFHSGPGGPVDPEPLVMPEGFYTVTDNATGLSTSLDLGGGPCDFAPEACAMVTIWQPLVQQSTVQQPAAQLWVELTVLGTPPPDTVFALSLHPPDAVPYVCSQLFEDGNGIYRSGNLAGPSWPDGARNVFYGGTVVYGSGYLGDDWHPESDSCFSGPFSIGDTFQMQDVLQDTVLYSTVTFG